MKKITALFITVLLISSSVQAQVSEDLGNTKPLANLTGIMNDVKSLERESNEERLEAIKTMLESRSIEYEIETFSLDRKTYPRKTGSNLIVTIGSGSSDIVIGGHWDAAWLRDGTLSKAVIDNGVAAVVLVRLAEELKNMSLKHRFRLVFFDMEEIGLVGSREFVKAHNDDSIACAINLDVLGYGNALMIGPAATAGPNAVYRAFKEACVDYGVTFMEFPNYPPSDDRSFQNAGIENISIGASPYADACYMWMMLNGGGNMLNKEVQPGVFKNIHSHNDNSDNVAEESVNIVYTVVLEMALLLDNYYK